MKKQKMTLVRKASLISLSFSLIASNSFAYDFKLLNKGDAAPYQGLLFTIPASKSIQASLKDYDKVKLLNASLTDSLTLSQQNEQTLTKELTEIKTDNQNLTKAVSDAQSNSFWTKAFYFGLGVVTTGLIVYATKK